MGTPVTQLTGFFRGRGTGKTVMRARSSWYRRSANAAAFRTATGNARWKSAGS
jgi:hypothetical protein